ncbi:hypothetical protein [Pseudoalteromonas arctica]|uniref:Alpha/beta hydrolase n=1 Tax=Pseudoalteromonas arctica TaxID=394751 RepID=A0A7Y0DQ32_9GAMM|nr:hypothetical protein [Pseudoalteromonas arctica]NMM39567.1 hypothetical protein [Pseudoalteromonas arctica]
MKILLLPGLDGTGLLFEKVTENLPENLDTEVISYELLKGVTYAEQGAELAKRFKDTDIYIVAESYSGRVAYEFISYLAVVFEASYFWPVLSQRLLYYLNWQDFYPLVYCHQTF